MTEFMLQDTVLLGIANILHHAGYINDAIVVMTYALKTSKDVVVSQFTLANLYAAKVNVCFLTQFQAV